MQREITSLKKRSCGDSPGGPVVKTPCLQSRGHGFDSWWGKLRFHVLRDTTSGGGEGVEPDALWTWIQKTWFVSRIRWELFPKEALNWEVTWERKNGTERISQFSSVAQSCPTLCDPLDSSTLGLPIHHQLLDLTQFMSIESGMPSNHLILCHPLLLLPSIFPSKRVFSNESVLCSRWPKYWSFSFSISPSNEYSGLISFRIDWFDLLVKLCYFHIIKTF